MVCMCNAQVQEAANFTTIITIYHYMYITNQHVQTSVITNVFTIYNNIVKDRERVLRPYTCIRHGELSQDVIFAYTSQFDIYS